MGYSQRKITDALDSQLSHDDHALLDVIVEFGPDPAEAATAPEIRAAFAKQIQPISAEISRVGGEVVDSVWLNRTLHARIPAEKVPDLAGRPEVAVLDVPHRITHD